MLVPPLAWSLFDRRDHAALAIPDTIGAAALGIGNLGGVVTAGDIPLLSSAADPTGTAIVIGGEVCSRWRPVVGTYTAVI